MRRVNLPADLATLLGATDERVVPVDLPPGRSVVSEGGGGRPVMWMSDRPAEPGVWAQLCAASEALGLWPLLLKALERDEDFRPWGSGELDPERPSDPRSHDASKVLAGWWEECTAADDDDEDDGEDDPAAARRLAVTAPYGQTWPGLAPSAPGPVSAAQRAARFADELLATDSSMRLGLVPAATGAEALRACGWQGPLNHTDDTGEIAAVVVGWEHRFGARVVGVGFDELYLSVAAPPATVEEALRVAAEHFAFCPDNIWQGAGTLAAYAQRLVGTPAWGFWWD